MLIVISATTLIYETARYRDVYYFNMLLSHRFKALNFEEQTVDKKKRINRHYGDINFHWEVTVSLAAIAE